MNNTIKMIIAGEEVVSNNEFTINEEMLSASSTILNNCYPKSWELTKDYTSNFYYPKDYSKFLLGEGEFLHGLEEYAPLEVSGTNITYETNVEKEWNTLNVYGRTYQATRSGKNLFDEIYPNLDSTVKYKAIYVGNGTFTMSTTMPYASSYTNLFFLTGNVSSGASTGTNGVWNARSRTITSTNGYVTVGYRVADNISPKNYNTQIEAGSTATTYEPYGVSPSPDYPSELVSIGYNNIWDEQWENGSFNNNTGQPYSTDTKIRSKNYIPIQPNNQYYVATPITLNAYYYDNNKTFVGANTQAGINGTFTTPNNAYYMRFSTFGSSYTTYSNNIAIFKGTQAHSYIPYGKYGIEIKNTGKNLLPSIDNTTTINGITFTKNIDGSINVNGTATANALITIYGEWNGKLIYQALDTNKYYTISGSNNVNIQIFIRTTNGTTITSHNPQFNPTFTGQSGIVNYFIQVINGTVCNNVIIKPQLEEGNTQTSFEPYKSNTQLYILDEPLRKIGDYQDRLYVDNGVLFVERKIGSVVLNGTQGTFSMPSTNRFNIDNAFTDYLKSTNKTTYLSNYYEALPQKTSNGDFNSIVGDYGFDLTSASSYTIRFKNKDIISVNDFKTWLSTHNTEVDYVLKTPTTTPIGYVDIPNSYEGINNVFLDTGLTTGMDLKYYWKNYNVLFAGVVKNSGEISLNPRHPHYCSLQVLDYKTFLSESNTLDFVIANKTVSEAIVMVVNAVAGYGFVVGDIDIDSANDIIGAYSTLNKTAYDVLQYLANISGSRWRARYVDETTTAIDFYDPDTLPQGANIDYTKQYWETNNIVDLSFNYGTRDYRNKQILLSDEVYANINYDETLISNGYSNTFTLQNNVGTIVKITINGDEKTVATTNDKQMGVDADFYYTPGKNIIESNIIYSAGIMIHLTYQPLVKGRQIVYNTTEVNRISNQTDTTGVIARYETRNDILSSDELEKIAKTYIEYKGKAEVILTLTTQNKDLYDIGEIVYFNAPIDDLKQNYMVKTKKIEYVVINEIINLFYVYELTSSFNSEKAINYFDNQRNKASGNISEGESITRNIDIETQALISWYEGTVSSASITVTGDNVLNSALNSPFVE